MSIAILIVSCLALVSIAAIVGPLMPIEPRPIWVDLLVVVGVLFLLGSSIAFVVEAMGMAEVAR